MLVEGLLDQVANLEKKKLALDKIPKVHLQLGQILDIQVLDLRKVKNLAHRGLEVVLRNQLHLTIVIHKDQDQFRHMKEDQKVQNL